jgi:hypothetical protein
MKKIFLFILLFSTHTLFAQCVELDRFFTGGLHYLTGKNVSGVQLEVGSTGNLSNISYYAIVNGFTAKGNDKDSATAFPKMVFGLKGAYRIAQVEGVLNLYITTAAGLDIVEGFYNANSIKVLTVLGGKVALSIEPSYLTIQKTFMVQAGINIILD